MNFALSPIRKLITAALILHIVGLFIATILTFWQIPLGNLFAYRHPDEVLFVFPTIISIVTITIIFACHCLLTIGFLNAINSEFDSVSKLKTTSVLSFIFVLLIFPIVTTVSLFLEHMFRLTTASIQHLIAYNILQRLMFWGLAIRGLGLSALLIAASMAFYYCYLASSDEDIRKYIK